MDRNGNSVLSIFYAFGNVWSSVYETMLIEIKVVNMQLIINVF